MSETKFGGKIVGHSENFCYHSENHCAKISQGLRNFRCVIANFFFLKNKNKIINKYKIKIKIIK